MKYIQCVFVAASDRPGPMPGVDLYEPAHAVVHIKRLADRGVTDFLIFGVPEHRGPGSATGQEAPVPRLLRQAREQFGNSVNLVADVGLSPYSPDGHSVVMGPDGLPDESASYAQAAELASAFVRAGADAVAPCLSLPDQVTHVQAAVGSTPVIPYSAKFASAMYGPYRQTVKSPLGAQRKRYQTDHTDTAAGLAQLHADVAAGCRTVIVKPTMLYLDVLATACTASDADVWAYHVSGEYMSLLLAAEHGGMNVDDLFDEYHEAVRRCGAAGVIGYASEHFLRWTR